MPGSCSYLNHIDLEAITMSLLLVAQEVLEIALRLLDEYDRAEAERVEDVREKIDAAIPRFGSARGLVRMSDDFDAPLEDFEEYAPYR
jgi:hypothetical protein